MIPKPTEHQEQVTLFSWAGMQTKKYPELAYMFAIPNGAFLGGRTAQQRANVAHKLKTEGLKSGVPDIFLPCPRGKYHGLFIEMKRSKGGQVSSTQRDYLDYLNSQGYFAVMARGFDEARQIIIRYLEA